MKIVNYYQDDFKLKVVRHYFESDEGYLKTSQRFNLSCAAIVSQWVRKFGDEFRSPAMDKPAKKEKPALTDYPEAISHHIKELEEALENERLKSSAMSTMINVAERDLKITIRKKSGAKPLKK